MEKSQTFCQLPSCVPERLGVARAQEAMFPCIVLPESRSDLAGQQRNAPKTSMGLPSIDKFLGLNGASQH